jgi:hypothetical protein
MRRRIIPYIEKHFGRKSAPPSGGPLPSPTKRIADGTSIRKNNWSRTEVKALREQPRVAAAHHSSLAAARDIPDLTFETIERVRAARSGGAGSEDKPAARSPRAGAREKSCGVVSATAME